MTREDWTPKPARGPEDHPHRERPPFEPGNEAAMTHGARSPRKVEELARQIDVDLLDRAPWIEHYPEALRAYGRAEAVARLLFNDIARVGAYDDKGQFRASIVAKWATAENTTARLREALGLTPKSEAEVARDRAAAASLASNVDLSTLAERGRAALAARGPAAPALLTADDPREDDRA